MKFRIIADTLNGFNNLVNLIPPGDIKFKDYYPNQGNKTFTGILHLVKPYKLKDLEGLISQLSNETLTAQPLGRVGKYSEEYKTTIEKLEEDHYFCVLRKNGTIRGKRVYKYDGYNRSGNEYVGQNCDNISDFGYFKKGQLVIANPNG